MRTATPGNLSKLLPEAVRYQGRTPCECRLLTLSVDFEMLLRLPLYILWHQLIR